MSCWTRHYIHRRHAGRVVDRFAHVRREAGDRHPPARGAGVGMDHPTTMRSIELMGAKVIPAMATV